MATSNRVSTENTTSTETGARITRRSARNSIANSDKGQESASNPAGDEQALVAQDPSASSSSSSSFKGKGKQRATVKNNESVDIASTSANAAPARSLRSRPSKAASPSTLTSGASTKALGKRRAISPAEQPEPNGETSASTSSATPPAKRRKVASTPASDATPTSTTSSTPSSSGSSYNLRPRGLSSASTSRSISTSKLNPANNAEPSTPATTPTVTRKMPRKGKAGGISKGDHSSSLRAKAAANAAAAAATVSHNASAGATAHANSQQGQSSSSGRRQRDPFEDDDDDMDDEIDQELVADAIDDSLQFVGGAEMELHDTEEEENRNMDEEHHNEEDDLAAVLQSYGGGPQGQGNDDEDDDDDGDDNDDEDEIGAGGDGDMMDDDFDVPLTFDADGNPLPPGAAGSSNAETSGAGGSAVPRPPGSSNSAHSEANSAAAAYAAAAAAAGGGDDGYGSFAASLRGYSGLMAGMSARLRTLLANLRNKTDVSVRMIALQELSELLSMSTEDTLAGYFSVDAFVKELVICLKGKEPNGGIDPSAFGLGDEEDDYAMAQAIAAAHDNGGDGADGGEDMQLLACRCLANLIEAMPHAAPNIVANGAVPILCSKLFEITFIDLAEQTISTLEKISEEMPNAIVREGGLSALLTYLDFFSTHVQRTALTAAANCCHSLSIESFSSVRDMMPILRNVLTYSDRKLVEQACLAITGVVDSYRHHPDKLEVLLTGELLTAIASLMVPGASDAQVDASTHPKILKLLSTAAKSSPEIAMSLIEMNIANTIYHLLTGVSPPSEEEGIEGIKKHLEQDDMLVLNNLVHRSKDVVQETLSLVHELLPALPKDGIFDPRAHMHRSKSKVKKEDANSRSSSDLLAVASGSTSAALPGTSPTRSPQRSPHRSPNRTGRSTPVINDDGSITVKAEEATPALEDGVPAASTSTSLPSTSALTAKPKETAQERRIELLASQDEKRIQTINRFFAMLLPILLDVYSASVGVQVRSKTFGNMLKIVQTCSAEYLPTILTIVPMAGFLASCFSTKDQPQLVIDALQMTELLLVKVPDTYQYYFRREGVMYEIERMADEPLLVVVSKPKKPSSSASTPAASTPAAPLPGMSTPADDGGDAADLGTRVAAAVAGRSTFNPPTKAASSAENLQKDAITLRAKHLRKMLTESSGANGSVKADSALTAIRALVDTLGKVSSEATLAKAQATASEALRTIAGLFSSSKDPMSSFEMQESGLIGGLLAFATSGKDTIMDNDHRRKLIMEAFMSSENASETPLTSLVKRLQEALGRAEEFDVLTALPSGGDSRSNPATMLGRQLKMRLVAAENSGIPRSVANVVVSIHAIATFSSFNDYLRPRIATALAAEERSRAGSPAPGAAATSSRLSGVLAAFAAATGMPSPGEENPTSALTEALSTSAPTASTTTTPSLADSGRRRSSRLSAKNNQPPAPETPLSTSAGGSSSLPSRIAAALASDASAMACDDDMDEDEDDILEGELAAANTTTEERLINFEVTDDGSRVSASTPDGTRIQTPVPGSSLSTSLPGVKARQPSTSSTSSTPAVGGSSTSAPPPGRSYAAALKAAPADWHLEFSMGGKPINMESTIFGAVYQHEVRTGNPSGIRGVWQNIYTVSFKKVTGPPPNPLTEGTPEPPNFETALPECLAKDPRQSTMLRLLGVLHQINSDWSETLGKQSRIEQLDVSAAVATNVFVNNKLTAKLNRQLEEPMIVASNCLPDWAIELPRLFPFLFPFETRYTFLQSTAFGYARLMQKWLQSARDNNPNNNRRDENLSFLGRLQRQKVRISRQRLFESAFKVFELYGSSKAMLEVEYFDEVGTGLGPTLEFYSLVSKEFRKKELKLWREGDTASDSEFVDNSAGLFPAPVDTDKTDTETLAKQMSTFKVLGMVVAKALMDSRIIDIPFSKMFMKLVLNQHIPLTVASVKIIDPALAKSLRTLEQYLAAKEAIEQDSTINEADKAEAIKNVKVSDASIEDLSLDFTLPGYSVDLKEGGSEIHVNMDNLSEYIRLVVEWTLVEGVKPMTTKFKDGFNEVFPVADLHTFTPEELVKLFGDEEEDWSFATISESIKADHGYSLSSNAIVNFIEIISAFDNTLRRKALSFLTGASRLPIGGFGGLNPQLTIVRKIPDDGLRMDDVLPSVMTPEYSSKEVAEERLLKAIEEGGGAFHLS